MTAGFGARVSYNLVRSPGSPARGGEPQVEVPPAHMPHAPPPPCRHKHALRARVLDGGASDTKLQQSSSARTTRLWDVPRVQYRLQERRALLLVSFPAEKPEPRGR